MSGVRSAFAFIAIASFTVGCGTSHHGAGEDVDSVRAKLSPEERALVEAQEWCPITTDDRLGTMGAPIKIELKGQPVFLCCKSCKKKADADQDKTLAKVEELKAKKNREKLP